MDEGMPSEVALVCFFWWGYFGLEQHEVLNANHI